MMRRAYLLVGVAALLGATLVVGCDAQPARPSGGVTTGAAPEGAERQLQKAKQETKEAVQATKDYAYALRAEAIKDMQAELVAINRALVQFSAKIESSNDTVKADAKAKLTVLREKAIQFANEIEKAKTAQEAAWADVKAGFKKSHDDLKESLAQARTWLSEKIAP